MERMQINERKMRGNESYFLDYTSLDQIRVVEGGEGLTVGVI